jgi:hypothetical protein
MSLTLQKGSRGGGSKGAQFTTLITAEPKSKGKIRIWIQEAIYLLIHRIWIHNTSLKYPKDFPHFVKTNMGSVKSKVLPANFFYQF